MNDERITRTRAKNGVRSPQCIPQCSPQCLGECLPQCFPEYVGELITQCFPECLGEPYPQCIPQCFTQLMGELLGELITQFMGEFMGECFTQLCTGRSPLAANRYPRLGIKSTDCAGSADSPNRLPQRAQRSTETRSRFPSGQAKRSCERSDSASAAILRLMRPLTTGGPGLC